MKKRLLFLMLTLFLGGNWCYADEGMWIPMLLKKYNIEDMQKQGFKLTAEDIYNINQASLKDAVVGLGREGRPFAHFCTAELVSNEGLMVTNHHCAYGMIQSHSSLENNYLRDGFWARDKKEELPNPGITASILVRMEDVTPLVQEIMKSNLSPQEKQVKLQELIQNLKKNAVKGTNLQADIKPYFNGNQYLMSIFKIYKDVRLVGAPPSAIGKFGGDTDNWMWPRHTGDFSVLRIYAGKDNEPATYSPDNKPYQPEHFFKISLKGVKEGDFTMVFGYPGTTNEYLTSYAIEQIQNIVNPHTIAIRTAKLNIINAAMESDDLLRIKYASKAANVANAWKKWQGEIKGLKRLNTIAKKQQEEQKFQLWAKDKPVYKPVLGRYKELYAQRKDLILASAYINEAGKRGAEIVDWAASVRKILLNERNGEQYKTKIKNSAQTYYKDYDINTDKKILIEMLKLYNQNLSQEWLPGEVYKANTQKGIESYVERLFEKSIFSDKERLEKSLELSHSKLLKVVEKDPAWKLYASIDALYTQKVQVELMKIESEITQLNKIWLAGLMEMQPEKKFYADANSTLRVSYGKVQGYSPRDGVYFKHYTTLKGMIEKDNPQIYDYNVPQKLREIYKNRDFGHYAQNGEIPVCFAATNHTTGGNSGSPVLNAEGHLIGINFDRAWEGVMSDMQYDPEICRNISVDIRYVLFIIDKFAEAKHLINEMVIVQ